MRTSYEETPISSNLAKLFTTTHDKECKSNEY